MKRRTPTNRKVRNRARIDEVPSVALDAIARQNFKYFARHCRRAGYSPQECARVFEQFVFAAPEPRKPSLGNATREFHDTGDVLTLWSSDPDCVDADGVPRPLPVRGPAPSVESLLRRARPDLPLEEALALFRRTHSLRKVGRNFVPINVADDSVIHSPQSQSQAIHHVIVMNQLLRNFEFNSKRGRRGQPWPQRVAECPDFPLDALPALISRFARVIRLFMKSHNHGMARIARKAQPSTPRKRVAIDAFLSVSPASRPRAKSAAAASETR